MFPEYRDLITRLKAENKTFARLFDEHNELDQRVKNIEAHIVPGTDTEIENLKKEKLQIKDRLYDILKDASAA
jgi:hypothetical protein